jgi:hypothetical protein
MIRLKIVGIIALLTLVSLNIPFNGNAHEPHECPNGFPDAPAISNHIKQADIVSGKLKFKEAFESGKKRFVAIFNRCDGQGRPATTGAGEKRLPDEPSFIRTSAPDANACSGCHNQPSLGGAGDFVANVFVLAQAHDPAIVHVLPDPVVVGDQYQLGSNERNTLGMNGAGLIEMLAREMSTELQSQASRISDGTHILTTKGVQFEVKKIGGIITSSKGVDTDLIIKPFHQAGVVRSIREFTVNAFNHHHGMQAEERFDILKGNSDFDEDGVTRELTIGDITATTIFQAALGTPGRKLPASPKERQAVKEGESHFVQIGCSICHLPAMELNSPFFVEPNPLNPSGTFSDISQSFILDMTETGEGPRPEKAPGGKTIVRAFTDLKRHNLCDDLNYPNPIRFFCNEQRAQNRPNQDGKPGAEFFITRKLWDVGNSAPYGHRGDLPTITEAILAHGGEAMASKNAFVALPSLKQAEIVKFLKTLQVLPPGHSRVVIEASSSQITQ